MTDSGEVPWGKVEKLLLRKSEIELEIENCVFKNIWGASIFCTFCIMD